MGDGGDFKVNCAWSQGYAGNIILNAGNSYGTGGAVNINSGNSDVFAGDISLTAGTSNNAVGTPGNITFTAGNGQGAGGNIYLKPGIDQSDTNDGLVIVNGSGTYTGTWTQASDRRFKDDITPIKNAAEIVESLEGVEYRWKQKEYSEKQFPNGKNIGLIAQDVEKVIPSLVETDKEGYKSIDYTKISVLLIEAFKEQQKKIEELSNRIKELESK
jgi:hypothetical protein